MQILKLFSIYLKYLQNLMLVSTVTGCILISAFALSVCVAVGITRSAVELRFCEILPGFK